MARHKELDDAKVLQDIYNAAVEILAAEGIEGLSIRKVCRLADISTGTFYHFYPTKQHLIERLIDYMENFYKNDVVPYLEGSGLEKLYTISAAYVNRIMRRGLDYAKQTMDFHNNGTLTGETNSRLYRTQLFLKVSQECVDNGEVKEIYTAQQICDSVMAVCRGLSLTYTYLNADVDMQPLIDQTLKIFIDGIKK